MNLGERIELARKMSGISQAELARRIPCKPQQINDLIKNNRSFSKHFPRIAQVLGVSVSWLSAEAGPMSPRPEAVPPTPPAASSPTDLAAQLAALTAQVAILTRPVPDRRDARIAELEAEVARLAKVEWQTTWSTEWWRVVGSVVGAVTAVAFAILIRREMRVRTYTIGRAVASVLIVLGWVAAVLASVVGVMGFLMGGGVLILAAFVAGLVNHAIWQLAMSLFDIADNTRQASDAGEVASAYLKKISVLQRPRVEPAKMAVEPEPEDVAT